MVNKRRAETKLFLEHVRGNNLCSVKESIASGINVRSYGNLALKISVKARNVKITTLLLKAGATADCDNNYPLRRCTRYMGCVYYWDKYYWDPEMRNHINDTDDLLLIKKLLEFGADLYCCNNKILKYIQSEFSEELALIILPYCTIDDHKYFPCEFVAQNIQKIKSANNV